MPLGAMAVSAAGPLLAVVPNHRSRQSSIGAKAMTVVGSLAGLLAGWFSPPPTTIAMLVTLAGALVATLTISVIGG